MAAMSLDLGSHFGFQNLPTEIQTASPPPGPPNTDLAAGPGHNRAPASPIAALTVSISSCPYGGDCPGVPSSAVSVENRPDCAEIGSGDERPVELARRPQ